MQEINFSTNDIAAIAGILISLAFFYVPGIESWYDSLTGKQKALWNLGTLFAACVIIFGAACGGFAADPGLCSVSGIKEIISAFVVAVIANASTFVTMNKIATAK